MTRRIRLLRLARRLGQRVAASRWPPHSRLLLVDDGVPWVLGEETRALGALARGLGVRVVHGQSWRGTRRQSIFLASAELLLSSRAWEVGHRVGGAYYHGRPGTGEAAFDRRFEELCRVHDRIDRVQVTNAAFREVILSSGIAPEKVHLIPLGIDLSRFAPLTPETKREARKGLGLAPDAWVVGSFQKDGVGWDEGLEPKMIKGPDLLLAALEQLRPRIPGLAVLISGPARGYVKRGFKRLGIPFRHVWLRDHAEIGRLYQAVDLCLVTSREEGGPKAVLEAMASGVPLVTTRVGMASDLVEHGVNAWMVEVGDVDGLVRWAFHVSELGARGLSEVVARGRQVAENHSYEALRPRWRALLEDFVKVERGR